MDEPAFVLCPRCRLAKDQIFTPLDQHEDGRIVCGNCNSTWPDLETLMKEMDSTKTLFGEIEED
jgi:hypothetical protein